jgi:amidase
VKSAVQGASRGKPKGKTVDLKANVMLAGVPMMNGAATLEGYIPNIDATPDHPALRLLRRSES